MLPVGVAEDQLSLCRETSIVPPLTRVRHKVLVFDVLLALLQAFHQPPVLVFELGGVFLLDPGVVLLHGSASPVTSAQRDQRTHSAIFSVRVSTLRAAVSSMGRVKSIESDSMQTLSAQVRSRDLVMSCREPQLSESGALTDVVSLIKDDD